jgi:predicted metal-dependent phosphoesterase TrpH
MLPNCLGKDLINNIVLFDAIEWNYFYSKLINPNKKAAKLAKKYNKPIVATSDVHILKHMPRCYSNIKVKNKSIDQILSAIKKNQLENHCIPFKTIELPVALFEIFQNTK